MYQVWQQKGAMSARELGRPHTALSRRASPVVRDDDHRKGHGDDAQAGEQRDEARLHSRCVWARFVLRVARGQGGPSYGGGCTLGKLGTGIFALTDSSQ
jgi:hypothetical protein